MRIVDAGYEILTDISENGQKELEQIEKIARVCYKSEGRIAEGSAERLVSNLIRHDHLAMLEHGYLSVKFIVDRGISHEIVRHRMASFAQESTRYCNYAKDSFGCEIAVIKPLYLEEGTETYDTWYNGCATAEFRYFELLNMGLKPDEAREVLPTSLKTEIVVTANYREWRHILKLRTAPDAHPQIREVMIPLKNELMQKMPIIFQAI